MSEEYNALVQMYSDTLSEIAYPTSWRRFLTTAAYNYKFDFHEQILIYAQNPGASVVMNEENWKSQFNRTVNHSKPIGLIEPLENKAKWVYDIKDTVQNNESTRDIPVFSFGNTPEHLKESVASLNSAYGINENSLENAVFSAIDKVTDEELDNVFTELTEAVESTPAAHFSKQLLRQKVSRLIANSSAYICMMRCSQLVDDNFPNSYFRDVSTFGTQAIISIGTITSRVTLDVMQTIIRANMRVNKKIYKNSNRTFANHSQSGYNVDTKEKHSGERKVSDNGTQFLRQTKTQISQRAQADILHTSGDPRDASGTSDRNSGASRSNVGESYRAKPKSVETGRKTQSRRPAEMDRSDEQSARNNEGASAERADLQLDYYDREHEDKSLPFFGNSDTIREILAVTPHLKASKDEIRAFYESNSDGAARTEYIKGIFNHDYTEVILNDGRRAGYKTFQNVLHLWEGSYLSRTAQSFYDWSVIAQHFEAMRLLGELQDTIKPVPQTNGQLNFIFENEAEVSNTSAFTFSQEIIDAVLTRGSGISEGKFRIYEQFEKSLSAKENADFLKEEYGWGGVLPVIVGTGIEEQHDGKGIRLSKGLKDNAPQILLNWKQVEKRISKLIHMNRYLNPKEKKLYPAWLEKQEERRARLAEERKNREILSTAPPEETIIIDPDKAQPNYEYHIGDTVYIGADEYEIRSFDDDRVMLYDTQFPLFSKEMNRAEFDRKVRENSMNDHLKVAESVSRQNTSEESELRFNAGDFEKLIPEHMRYKATELVNGNEKYWVTQGIFNVEDLRDFQQAIKKYDGDIKKFYITSRSISSSYSFEEDMANKVLAIITPDTLLKDDYINAIKEAGLTEYMNSEISEENRINAPNSTPISNDNNHFQHSATNLPTITCEWSESLVFEDGKTYSVAEFDSLMKQADEERINGRNEAIEKYGSQEAWYNSDVQDEYTQYKGYDKVKFTVNMPNGTTYTERQDIGDGYGGVIDFLKQYPNYNAIVPILENALVDELQTEEKTMEASDFDIGMGYLGNGLTVWNRAVKENGDYQNVAHISDEGEITYYVGDLPEVVTVQIEQAAEKEKVHSQFLSDYRAYSEFKHENPDSILLYQAGDSFEAYGNDAQLIGAALKQNLTSRSLGSNQSAQVCVLSAQRLETYLNMLTDRGYDVAICSLENGERITRNLVSTNKEDPLESQPVGRIEYLNNDDDIIQTVEYTSEYQFKKDISEESSFGVAFRFYVYQDENGKTIDITFISKLHAPLNMYKIIDSPYLSNRIDDKSHQPEDLSSTENTIDEPKPIVPAWEQKKSKVSSFDLHPDIPMSDRHTFDLKNNEVETVGKKERFRRNLEAIQVLKECEFENRFATPEEQITLSKYVGWGGIPEAFDENNTSWANEFTELYTLLSPEEYAAARESTLTAFYTPPEVITAMYKAMEQLGLKEGNLLEPSCGIGNFIGMLPDNMSDCRIYGVELDTISAGIAGQLYQKSSIAAQGFEKTNVPDSFFDGIVGNVPFGDFKLLDKRYDKYKFLIHDYFFAKSLDKLRPGGVLALVTSKGTMDKENPSVRKYIAQRAELLGAVRLPNNTFKGNAGTEVVSDILFLQKRDRLIDIEPDWVHLNTDENGIKMNSYFVEHPEMVLGKMKMVTGRFGMESTCEPYENADLASQLNEAVANIHGEITSYEIEDVLEADNLIPADPSVRNFSYTILDDRIYFRENSRMSPVEVSAKAENRIKGMIAIRDSVRNLIELQTEDFPDTEIKAEQKKLNELYDKFTAKHGLINSRANVSAFSEDSSFSLLSALEIIDEDGNLERKADMFSKRTIKPHAAVTSVDTASEALAVSMGEKAAVDMEYMCQLCGKSEEEIFADLQGVIFLNPKHSNMMSEPKYLMADEYLSGNVREKLAFARMAAKVFSADYNVNVEALEKVQPTDLTASEISVRLGATWLPVEIARTFMFELLNTPMFLQWGIKIHFSPYTSEWNIEGKSLDKTNVKVNSTYGTSRINAYKIIEETLNMKDVRIFDYIEDEEGKTKAVLNKKETAIALSKQELIKQAFQDWIWKDPARREKLTKLYNEKFNSNRPREYDGRHITFNGMNPEIQLREHQRNAVAHILYGGNTLLAHAVGAGKTFEMVAAAQELKRLGLCNKSLFVVPNHLTEQWAAEYLQLYPSANILVATKKDFETKNRKRFCGRIATGDYDAVIIGHSQFEKIPMSVERQKAILEQQIEELTTGIAELKRNRGESFSIKQLEKSRKSIKQKLEKLNDQSRKDDVVTFEELGVDRLFIDESHYYKNLYLYTKMRNVGGIAQTEAQKSSDLFMKCRYLDEITGGRGTVFATGTPISNSMVELYTIQRYLQYSTLVKNGLQNFDAWASTFGETVTAVELTPEGTGYRAKTRFAKFYNLPELMAMFKEVADIKTADMLQLPVPEVKYHNVAVKPSEIQKEMVSALADRAENVRNGDIDASVDNMLKITNDGRKLALDQRMLNNMLPDSPGSKINACVDNIYRIWKENADKKSAQLVFCDLSTPKNDGTFSVYDDIRKKLIERGIPESEIRFIHEANTDIKKKELFQKTRKGEVRILMGSTQKMGAGTNVQDRLIALHDVDCPWRPSDLEQRSGRIIRQGNSNPQVEIYRYVTEQTFDAYLYQLVEGKQKFASQIMTSKSPVRSAEDIDETALSYAEIKMLATGNPYIKEKMDLDIQVQKLKLLKSNFLSEKYALEDKTIKYYPQRIANLTERVNGLVKDVETAKQHPKPAEEQPLGMTVSGVSYSEKAAAGAAIIDACKVMRSPDPISLGTYRGFKMELYFDRLQRLYTVILKGQTSLYVSIGTDAHGNILRIDNAIERFAEKLTETQNELENTKHQLEIAKKEIEKSFNQEEELQTKTARLMQLNALLNTSENARIKNNELADTKSSAKADPQPLSL